jgi:hypothetical protein
MEETNTFEYKTPTIFLNTHPIRLLRLFPPASFANEIRCEFFHACIGDTNEFGHCDSSDSIATCRITRQTIFEPFRICDW